MANAGPSTIVALHVTLEATPGFGQVTDGMDVVDKLEGLPTDRNDRPQEDAKIEKLTIA